MRPEQIMEIVILSPSAIFFVWLWLLSDKKHPERLTNLKKRLGITND